MTRYRDRRDAGRALAKHLSGYRGDDLLVLALPRGGVPVAYEVARALGAELDVLVARKIGAPGRPELGVGAIAEGGAAVYDERGVRLLGLEPEDLAGTVAEEREELARRVRHYRGDRPLPTIEGRTVIVVDDGLATGVTARAALQAVRAQQPARVVMAAPVCAPDTAQRLRAESADEVVCPQQPEHFAAVGQWYVNFDQTSDQTVLDLLAAGRDDSTVRDR